MSNRIYVHVFVSNETYGYFNYMVSNYIYLADQYVDFICYTYDEECYDNLNGKHESYLLTKHLPNNIHAGGIPAYLHYLQIKESFKRFKSNSINIIADTDTVMLVKGWDSIIRESLNNHYCVGIEYYSNWHYRELPCFIWVAFSDKGLMGYDEFIKPPFPNIENNQCFFIPIKKEELFKFHCKLNFYDKFDDEISEALKKHEFNGDYATIMVADPCWDFPEFIHSNGLVCDLILNRGINDNYAMLHNVKFDHVEGWLGDKLLLAHQLGGRIHKFKESEFSSEFYTAAESYIAEFL